MHAPFSSFEQWSIADAEIGVTDLNGVGGHMAPHLWLPVRLTISHKSLGPRDGLDIVSLSGRLSTEIGPLSTSSIHAINVILNSKANELRDHLLNLEFPLDGVRVAALERLRAGGDLKLRLDAVLEVVKLYAIAEPQADVRAFKIPWTHVQRHLLRLQTEVLIPRHTWVSRVLPNVGYGVVHLIELPAVPLAACATFDYAFKALPPTVHRTAVELNPAMVELDALANRVHYGDFLKCNGELGTFDRIIANPPFRAGQDVDHLRHMYGLLNPGGIIVTVMSPTWQYREDRKFANFRAWLEQLDNEVQELPEGTFKTSGTNVRAVLVTIRK